jgi:hypothetical protein
MVTAELFDRLPGSCREAAVSLSDPLKHLAFGVFGSAPVGANDVSHGARVDYSLYDAPHAFREFGVTDPDGHDIAFGQRLGD